MSSQGFIPDPLSEAQLKALVLEAISKFASDAQNPERYHARFGHLDRGIQTDDVLFALRGDWKRFKVQRPFNEKFWQWNYRIFSCDVDERELILIIAVDTANREFEVITRWPNDNDNAQNATNR